VSGSSIKALQLATPGATLPRAQLNAKSCPDGGNIRVFRYIPEVDAFDVEEEYVELARLLGLDEWSPIVWIGRLFAMDNDFGEHWFDNWEAREERRSRAEALGLNIDRLLVVDPERFQDGRDGPCNPPEIRRRFWHDVLVSLDLSAELIFAKARAQNEQTRIIMERNPTVGEAFIADLEQRIARWRRDHSEG